MPDAAPLDWAMKILFIVPYPTEGASNRYRIEQYLPFLESHGAHCCLRPFINTRFYKILYSRGNRIKKAIYFLYSSIKRLADTIRAAGSDIIFVHIEAFPLGPPMFELLFRALGKPIIFDFEDAIYMPSSDKSNIFKWAKFPNKFYSNVRLSAHVIVCNNYLREKLYNYNPLITVIPTSIDTDKFKLKADKPANDGIVIGWIGSHTTLPCLKQIFPALRKLSRKCKFILKIIGGGKEIQIPGIKVISEKWSLDKEVENFQSLDIGIYPLPDNEWAMAKTPFKTIQYMSVGVPAVASNVGGNKEIIQDGVNGFLAFSEEEWVDKLSLLINNPGLRNSMGRAGRKTVEEKYSLRVNRPKFLEIINTVYKNTYKI